MNRYRPVRLPAVAVTLVLTCSWVAILPSRAISEPPPAESENTEEAEDTGPSTESVMRRAIVVAAVYALRFHPHSGERAPDTSINALEDDRVELLDWFQTENLWMYASEWEQRVLRTRVGSLKPKDFDRVYSLGDDLRTLLFALRLQPKLPSPNGRSAGPLNLQSLPRAGQSLEAFVADASRQKPPALQRVRDIADLWFLRASIQRRVESESFPDDTELASMAGEVRDNIESIGLTPVPISDSRAFYDELVRFTAHWAYQEGLADEPLQDDLPVFDGPFRDLDAPTKATLLRQAENRVRTLDWLIGDERGE